MMRRRAMLIALLVFNIPWIIGYAVLDDLRESDQAQDDRDRAQVAEIRDAAREAHGAARDAKWQAHRTKLLAKRNKKVIHCLTEYAVTATLALGSQSEWVRTFRTLVASPPAGGPAAAREQFLEATAAHLRNLRKVTNVKLGQCLQEIDAPQIRDTIFELAAHETDPPLRLFCMGRRVTIHGSKRGDVIHGTDRGDVIRSRAGVDLIVSGGGRDRICAGRGGDIVNAGKGFDRVKCGPGRDNAQQAERRRGCEF